MILRTLLGILLLTTLAACGGEPASDTASSVPPPAPAAAPTAFESIEVARLVYLAENATYMDATFYDLPVSINQSELSQIQSTLATISSDPMPLKPECKPLGHIWFQVDGKNIEEADIYFQAECVGYVWYENGQPAYSNKMTQDGLNFYGNILQSVQQNQ